MIEIARDDVHAYGGTFALVYLPDCNPATYRRQTWRDALLKRLDEAKITVLDGDKPITRLGSKAFFFCPTSHYAPAGAKAIADLILGSLKP